MHEYCDSYSKRTIQEKEHFNLFIKPDLIRSCTPDMPVLNCIQLSGHTFIVLSAYSVGKQN